MSMKKLLWITALACLCACSNEIDQEFGQTGRTSMNQSPESHKIDKSEAIEIANLYFSKGKTRTSTVPLMMEYIVDHETTRSGMPGSDTLAYVLNRGADNGFVMVSSDDRVYPILAHSQTGTFKYEKGDMVEEFISRIGAYLEENEDNETHTMTSEELDACYSGFPALTASWDQGSPWNKYVVREHPGCPAGCVAVATGMVMAHCKFSLTYHNVNFQLARIIAGLKKSENGSMIAAPATRIVGGDPPRPEVEPYSYNVAIDYAAQLLYWIGKDVNMSYAPGGSGAAATAGYNLLKKQGYVLGNPGLANYNMQEAIRFLTTKNLVYMRGSDTAGRGGHAWVADACTYCVNYFTNDTTMAELHIDWGWGGSNNGYYSGKVFAAGSYKFGSMQQFGIKIQ